MSADPAGRGTTLLVVDVGNTHIVLGVYRGDELAYHWRLETNSSRTADEYGVLLRQLFEAAPAKIDHVDGCMLSSVVPPMESMMADMVRRYFGIEPLVVGRGIDAGMPVLYDNPSEVGADRIVNAVAAYARTGCATIVVDFGTATTFDAISGCGEYLGGAICPGVTVSADALYRRASKLPRVDIALPDRIIARNTVASMQSGIVYGYVALVDGMVERFIAEYGEPMRVLATGGLSALFADHCRTIDDFDADLTLEGLRLIYRANTN